jgi:hypothetical protein
MGNYVGHEITLMGNYVGYENTLMGNEPWNRMNKFRGKRKKGGKRKKTDLAHFDHCIDGTTTNE